MYIHTYIHHINHVCVYIYIYIHIIIYTHSISYILIPVMCTCIYIHMYIMHVTCVLLASKAMKTARDMLLFPVAPRLLYDATPLHSTAQRFVTSTYVRVLCWSLHARCQVASQDATRHELAGPLHYG